MVVYPCDQVLAQGKPEKCFRLIAFEEAGELSASNLEKYKIYAVRQ